MPAPTRDPFWRQPAFWITLLLVPLVYIVTIMVLWPANGYSSEIRIMVITAVGVGLLAAITGYWLSTSYSSSKKDDALLGKPSAPDQPAAVTTINNQTKES